MGMESDIRLMRSPSAQALGTMLRFFMASITRSISVSCRLRASPDSMPL